jgi:hypothetical protein
VRHVFSITARGRRELRAWLDGPTEPPAVRNELLLKLFLAPGRAPADTRRLLSAYREGALKRLEDYAESERVLRRSLEEGVPPAELRELLGDEPGRPATRRLAAFLLTLRHGVLATEARLAWCEEALALLGQQRRSGKGARS